MSSSRPTAILSVGVALAVSCLIGDAFAQTLPAFSGADGAAVNVTGGRGGIVYHVTKLNSAIDDPQRNDPGTIRYGLNSANFPAGVPRTIVFDVGGVFNLGRLPQAQNNWDPNGNGWDAQSRLTIGGMNVTLAGQTAPGPGVIFMGGGLKPQGNNNIIRNITVAAGYGLTGWWKPGDPFPAAPGTGTSDASQWFPDNTVFDAMDIAGTNLMIDHVSTIYATDETISMNEVANNISVQYSNISQGQNYPQWDPDVQTPTLTGHALGSLLEAGSGTSAAISFHHNLYAHLKGRVPQTQAGSSGGGYYDFRNNVFYNWLSTAGTKSGNTFVNLASNFYLAGNGGDQPVGGTNPAITTQNGGSSVLSASSSVYRNGNLLDIVRDADPDDGGTLSAGGAANPLWANGAPTYSGVTDAARTAFDRVLNYVGANWWTRGGVIDTPDERIINEARTGTGKIMAWADDPWNNSASEGVEWRTLKNTQQSSRGSGWDTDQDGMPDEWEAQYNLNPSVADNNGDFDADGYTNLEEYLNEVAEWPAPAAIVFNAATNTRYAQITNWDVNSTSAVSLWQPSKYDETQVNSGTAVVDAVGQHAGTLVIAAHNNETAQVNITGGWLKASNAVVIGGTASANGTLNLSGGLLDTPFLTKGAAGAFNFTGGVLSADAIDFTLINSGGTLAPGNSPGITIINGNYVTSAGALEIELSSAASYDTVNAINSVLLGGDLIVKLLNGFVPDNQTVFTIITGNSIAGTFENVTSGRVGLTDAEGSFLVTVGDHEVTLSDFLIVPPILAGDFNDDGFVDSADYVVWRKLAGTDAELANETRSIGTIDSEDYDAWRENFGATSSGGSGGRSSAPEPPASLLLLAGLAMLGAPLRMRQGRSALQSR